MQTLFVLLNITKNSVKIVKERCHIFTIQLHRRLADNYGLVALDCDVWRPFRVLIPRNRFHRPIACANCLLDKKWASFDYQRDINRRLNLKEGGHGEGGDTGHARKLFETG